MTNRSKAVGTAVESAVVAYLQRHGHRAKRLTLHGNKDVGDIDCGRDDIVVECKGGAKAEQASDGQIEKWLEETAVERRNAKAAVGVLVVKRKGIGPANAGRWWVVTTLAELDYLAGNPFLASETFEPTGPEGRPVRIHLETFSDLVRRLP